MSWHRVIARRRRPVAAGPGRAAVERVGARGRILSLLALVYLCRHRRGVRRARTTPSPAPRARCSRRRRVSISWTPSGRASLAPVRVRAGAAAGHVRQLRGRPDPDVSGSLLRPGHAGPDCRPLQLGSAPGRNRQPDAPVPARERPVRTGSVLAPPLRRADLALRRAARRGALARDRRSARGSRRVLRRLAGRGHHARGGAVPGAPVALSAVCG